MGYSRNEVENILKTLPIGYYIKRKVNVSMSDTAPTAYYNPVDDSITVSYPLIAEVLDGCADDKFAEENIRTLLYHEVSHALLTPKGLTVTNVMNIFEDERIESVLRNFYMGVNFRDFIKRINHYTGKPFKTADEAFYGLVRFRVCSEQYWLDELHSLIMRFSNLNRNSESTYYYSSQVDDFYTRFCQWWNDNNTDSTPDSDSDDSEDQGDDGDDQNTGDSGDGMSDDSDDSKDGDSDDSTDGDSDDTDDSDDTKDGTPSEEIEVPSMTDIIQSEMDEAECSVGDVVIKSIFVLDNPDLSKRINAVLSGIKNFAKRNGSAINAYSGVFDPRSVVRDDCRYFVQKNRLGNAKAFSKTKINLFIDRSGSFWENTEKVNQLLKALADFEKQNSDFSFDLITMGVGDKLCSKNEREFSCSGGNWLRKDIFDIFSRVQDKGSDVYNIVLFDGDAFTDVKYGYDRNEEYKNFRAFNFKNVFIISDPSNTRYIDPNCPSAHITYTKSYTKELFDNVLNILNKMSR